MPEVLIALTPDSVMETDSTGSFPDLEAVFRRTVVALSSYRHPIGEADVSVENDWYDAATQAGNSLVTIKALHDDERAKILCEVAEEVQRQALEVEGMLDHIRVTIELYEQEPFEGHPLVRLSI